MQGYTEVIRALEARVEELQEFVDQVARLTCDGERDEAGEKFEMAIDDAFDTLHRLIRDARDLETVGNRRCPKCGGPVDEREAVEEEDEEGKMWVYCSEECRERH